MMDTPIPLARAIDLFFPEGGATISSLRTEARKGRLQLTRIAGRDYVTEAAMRGMIEKCRVEQSQRASKSIAGKAENQSGSSETERTELALAAAWKAGEKLKKRSRTTSPASFGRTPENVVSLTSKSPK